MARLAARYLALLAALVLLNFLLPRLLPGDPLDLEGPGGLGAATPTLSAAGRERLRSTYHLDLPPGAQLVAYLADLGRGDLGWSIARSAPVGELIAERLPWTLALVGTAVLASATGGVLAGVLAAWRGGRLERAVAGVATLLAGLPELLVALGLLLVLSVGPGWFPLQGGRSPRFDAAPGDPASWLVAALDVAWHLALPALTLALAAGAGFVLLARGAMRAVLAEPYLVVARAKGLPERDVALRHALPNAAPPILALVGLRLGQVLGGAIVVERVFAIPGLGLLAFEAVAARDYPVLQGVFLLSGSGVLAATFLVELAGQRLPTGGGRA